MSLFAVAPVLAVSESSHPFNGVTYIVRSEKAPRAITMHIVKLDLGAPGIRFKLTPAGGSRETILQTTLEFLKQEHAQASINCHFYVPFPATDTFANVVGLAASEGNVYSGFESQPVSKGYPDQSYAIISFAPALNIDPANHVDIVHRHPSQGDNRQVQERVTLWNVLSGSAQIVSNGITTIPSYSTDADGLKPISGYSDTNPWYSLARARTAIGLTAEGSTLVLFTVDQAGGSLGMSVVEVADMLVKDYQVYNALNLDGGPSTTLALEDPLTHLGAIVNASPGNAVGSNLAVFAQPNSEPPMRLHIRTTADQRSVVSWPENTNGFLLEFTTQLSPEPHWQPVTPPPAANTFTTLFNQSLRYYQLRKP